MSCDKLNIAAGPDYHSVDSEDRVNSKAEVDEGRNKLIRATILCVIFMLAEIIGGYFAHSLAIMTDAAHLLTDVAGNMIGIVAMSLARRQATIEFTFGFHRVEIIGALASVLLIWVLTGILVYEAVQRLLEPEEVNGELMLIVSSLGLVINLLMLCVLGGHGHSHGGGGGHGEHEGHGHSGHGHFDDSQKENINVSAAYIHVLGDLLQTMGVMLAAGLIWWEPFDVGTFHNNCSKLEGCSKWAYADPACTCLFALLVLYTTKGIAQDSMDVLMSRAPTEVDIPGLLHELRSLDGVVDVHDFHLWAITSGKNAACMHVIIRKDYPHDPEDVVLHAAHAVCAQKKIGHTTIQIEHEGRCPPHHGHGIMCFDALPTGQPILLNDTHGHSEGHGHNEGHGHGHGKQEHGHGHGHMQDQGEGHGHSHEAGYGGPG